MQQAGKRGLRRRGAKIIPPGGGDKALYACILSERSAEGAKTRGAAVCTRPHIAGGGGEKTHGCPTVHITVGGNGKIKDAKRCRAVRAPPYTVGGGGGGYDVRRSSCAHIVVCGCDEERTDTRR